MTHGGYAFAGLLMLVSVILFVVVMVIGALFLVRNGSPRVGSDTSLGAATGERPQDLDKQGAEAGRIDREECEQTLRDRDV